MVSNVRFSDPLSNLDTYCGEQFIFSATKQLEFVDGMEFLKGLSKPEAEFVDGRESPKEGCDAIAGNTRITS